MTIFARLLKGLTIAVGNRKNRILFYRFLAAEIRALRYSYGVGDGESYKRALTFLEECERLTLRSLVRKSAEHHVEVTVDHAKRLFLRALERTQCLTCTGLRSGTERLRHHLENEEYWEIDADSPPGRRNPASDFLLVGSAFLAQDNFSILGRVIRPASSESQSKEIEEYRKEPRVGLGPPFWLMMWVEVKRREPMTELG